MDNETRDEMVKLADAAAKSLSVQNLWGPDGRITVDNLGKFQTLISNFFNFNSDIVERKGVFNASQFQIRDVEPLMEQANALLERAISDRAALQSVGEKLATFYLDVVRNWKLVVISNDERTNGGRFETPFKVSAGQFDAQNIIASALDDQVDFHSKVVAFLREIQPFQAERTGYGTMLSLSPDDGTPVHGWVREKGAIPNASLGIDEKSLPPGSSRQDQAGLIAAVASSTETEMRAKLLDLEQKALESQKSSAKEVLHALEAQLNWDNKNQQFLAHRADVDSDMLLIKLVIAQCPWLLNFRAQFEGIRPRYQQSLRDAHDRLLKVSDGLKQLYGYQTPDGKLDEVPKSINDESAVDAVIAWVRRATTWLAAFTRLSQNYILPISVRKQCADSWDDGARKRAWSFTVGADQFPNQARVRIRGFAAWVKGGDDDRLWTVNLTLPKETYVIDEARNQSRFNQGTIQCRISKVTQRSPSRLPDISGLTSCFNASPLCDAKDSAGRLCGDDGKWVARIEDAFGQPVDAPDDVQIDLYVSVVSQTAPK
jgi:hypothetical protein